MLHERGGTRAGAGKLRERSLPVLPGFEDAEGWAGEWASRLHSRSKGSSTPPHALGAGHPFSLQEPGLLPPLPQLSVLLRRLAPSPLLAPTVLRTSQAQWSHDLGSSISWPSLLNAGSWCHWQACRCNCCAFLVLAFVPAVPCRVCLSPPFPNVYTPFLDPSLAADP